MLITISEASKQSGAPSQPAIHRMTKNKRVPGFLTRTSQGWRVDTGNPEWGAYIQGVSRRALPQKLAGNQVKKAEGTARPAAGNGREDEGGNDEAQNTTVQKAAEAKIIYYARREKLKLEQDEIKTNALKKQFADRAEAEYWLSFMQRAVTDSFSAVKRVMPEVRRLAASGDGAAAERAVSAALKGVWEQARRALQDAMDGSEETA
jgi:hypothetical protein